MLLTILIINLYQNNKIKNNSLQIFRKKNILFVIQLITKKSFTNQLFYLNYNSLIGQLKLSITFQI